MSPSKKLLVLTLVAVGSATWLAYSGASASWQYYVTIDECLADAAELTGRRLRVNGKVAAHSLKISDDRSLATFDLQGTDGRLGVTCPGPLPDNLREEMDVVVEGTLVSPSALRGSSVLTRCASKYEPRPD